MNKKSEPLNIKLEDLVLDKNNPRFAELYSGSDKEEEIIDYLLYNESAEDVAKAIKNANEFYPDRPLWVIKENGKYTVKDGNRRCAAAKALQHPGYYKLGISKMEINELPVLHYFNVSDIETRIREEHTSNLFKQWDRIAKALEIHRLFTSGNSIESLKSIDSSPKDFLKLANFYFEAVKIGSEDLKRLLRSGRRKTGGKTIVFERLFKYHDKCGYSFKNITSEIVIKDQKLFDSYISAMVHYLKDNPDTTHKFIDNEKENFFTHLEEYGFPPKIEVPETTETTGNNNNSGNTHSSNDGGTSTNNAGTSNDSARAGVPQSVNDSAQSNNKRKSIKQRPSYTRKRIPAPLEKVIKECYDLDQNNFANAKMALVRVAFECTMKFVVENTKKSNGKMLSTSNHIKPAFYDKTGKKLVYTNFDTLKTKFTELILDKSTKNAFENFDLQRPHQIIHNYKVAANPVDSKSMCDNLIELIEFMLQDEVDFMSSIDVTKL